LLLGSSIDFIAFIDCITASSSLFRACPEHTAPTLREKRGAWIATDIALGCRLENRVPMPMLGCASAGSRSVRGDTLLGQGQLTPRADEAGDHLIVESVYALLGDSIEHEGRIDTRARSSVGVQSFGSAGLSLPRQ
jgi:hypothetical protein